MSGPAPAIVGRRRRFPWVPVLILLLLGALVLALVAWEGSMSAAIYPGVRIAGVDVGGLTPAQARARLAPLRRAAMERAITVYAGDQRWSVTPAALGLRLNLDDRIREAYALGREPDAMARYGTQIDLALNGRNLSLIGNY